MFLHLLDLQFILFALLILFLHETLVLQNLLVVLPAVIGINCLVASLVVKLYRSMFQLS